MARMIIESSNKADSPADIEDKLEKALSSIRLQREGKEFSDVFLKDLVEQSDKVTEKVFNNMIEEVCAVLKR